MSLPPVLRVIEVMERYGMKDQRTARRLMNEAGAFKVGGRLVVREDDLGAYERRKGQPQNRLARTSTASPKRPAKRSHLSPADGPDWWRAGIGSDAA